MSKRHHYIPRYYLKGFTDPRNRKKIWVYPKDGNTPFRTSIDNVGLETHFYSVVDENGVQDSDTVEQFLAEKIEQPANSVIKKIRRGAPITAEEKHVLAVYVVGMLTRVPRSRERAKRDIPRLVQQAREITRETLHELASDSPEDQQRLKRMLRETSDGFVKIEKDLIEELSLPFFDDAMITAVSSMSWMLFNSNRRSAFVASDNPFCYTEIDGLLSESSQFIFPVSSNVVLMGSWARPGSQDSINYGPMPKKANDAVNKIVIGSSTRYVYHRTKSKWVSDIIEYMAELEASGSDQ